MAFDGLIFKPVPKVFEIPRYLQIEYAGLPIAYPRGELVARIYRPKHITDLNGRVVNVAIGATAALDEVDEQGNFHGYNEDALLRAPAQRGSIAIGVCWPGHGNKYVSDGEFIQENYLDATVYVNKRLREEGIKRIHGIGHSFGAYNKILSIHDRKEEYTAIACINSLLSFKDFYEANGGQLLVKLLKRTKNSPQFIKNIVGDSCLYVVNKKNKNPHVHAKGLAFLKVGDPYTSFTKFLEDPRLYEYVKEPLKIPTKVYQCVNDDSVLMKTPMDEKGKEDLTGKLEKIIDPQYLDFEEVGTLGESGPDHCFKMRGSISAGDLKFQDPKFQEVMDSIDYFFDAH